MSALSFELVLVWAILIVGMVTWLALGGRQGGPLHAGWILSFVVFGELVSSAMQQVGAEGGFNALVAFGALTLMAGPVVARSPARLVTIVFDRRIWWWWAVAALAALSLLWSSNPEYGAHKLMLMLVMGMAPGLATAVLASKHKTVSGRVFLFIGCVYAATVLATGEEVLGRLAMTGGNPIWAARSALLLVAVALWGGGRMILLRAAAIGLGLWLAAETGSRGPLIAFLAAPALVWIHDAFLMPQASGRRFTAVLKAGAVAIAFVCVWLMVQPSDSEVLRTNRLGTLVEAGELSTDINVVTRMDLQAHALTMIAAHPLVGSGLGAFAPRGTTLYPHNLALEIGSELGVVGLALWTASLVAAFRAARSSRLLRILLLQVTLYSFTSGDLGFNNYVPMFALLAIGERLRVGARVEARAWVGGPSRSAPARLTVDAA